MKAIEAAEHSDLIYDQNNTSTFYRVGEKWINEYGDVIQLNNISSDTYVPLVPKKIYKVGDKVTFLEALNSGMCFQDRAFCYRLTGSIFERWEHDKNTPEWVKADGYAHLFFLDQYTLCEDPSIPPKPTLESLPAWTRCRVKPVNFPTGIYDVIKKPTGGLMYYRTGKDFEWSNVKLTSIYNPKTEQWKDV